MQKSTVLWVALAFGLVVTGCSKDLTNPINSGPVAERQQDFDDNDDDLKNEDHEEHENDGRPFTYAVIGDFPYGPVKRAEMPFLVDMINADPDVERVLHAGDIKAGTNTACTDEYNADIRAQFDRFDDPLVYTPGDNEWTDCHVFSKNNGLYTPTERLIAVRKLFFPIVGRTLGVHSRRVTSQRQVDLFNRAYLENVMWSRSDILFASLNITGSNNDKAAWTSTPPISGELPADASRYPTQMQEQATRARATHAWLRRAFWRGRNAKAIVLLAQADMWDPTSLLDGYDDLVAEIGSLARSYGRPVLLIEGDSHVYRVDQPYTPASLLFGLHANTPIAPNVTRLVMNGSASRTEYVRLTIDPRKAKKGQTPWTFVEVPLSTT